MKGIGLENMRIERAELLGRLQSTSRIRSAWDSIITTAAPLDVM